MNPTPTEIVSILNLSKLEGVSYADISRHKSGNYHIDVCSEVDAAWNPIDLAISEIFPQSEYVSVPTVSYRPEGVVADNYRIALGSGLEMTLHMLRGTKKPSVGAEDQGENIQVDCITD